MSRTLSIALAQVNPLVGDVDGNAGRVLEARREAGAVDLVITPELVVAGYPPEDLVLKPAFLDRARDAVERMADATADGGPAVLAGAPWRVEGRVHNAALLLEGGRIAATILKHELPNYGVFDERRVFAPGPLPAPVAFRGVSLGVMVCEDMWFPRASAALARAEAELLVVLNGSPYEVGKTGRRLELARARVAETGLPLVYVNMVGGQDELVFDGGSFVLDRRGATAARLAAWREQVASIRWRGEEDGGWSPEPALREPPAEEPEAIYRAMVTGLRDYVNKNFFPGVLIGLSGGIDSALSAAVAVDALGADRVHCVMMPSRFTSVESLDDAVETSRLLGMPLSSISIEPAMAAFEAMLCETFVQHPADTTEENIQARSRGITLMALSNKFGHMVLSTGNKSEMSVGYATLYGDMCGGYSVLKDVYKTTVFQLSRWRNQALPEGLLGPAGRVIPENVITKAPTAELKPDQKDQDTLPPYEELDAILIHLIEGERSPSEVIAAGHAPETVARVWRLVDRAEYKRRQAPPGVKISSRAFGRDRRYPLTNGFTGLA